QTDERGFGQFDAGRGNARLFSYGSIESTQIGNAEKGGGASALHDTGVSHRRPLITPTIWGATESKKAPLTTNEVTIKDTGPCETTITVRAAASYPFRASPEINYTAIFTFTKQGSGKVKVKLKGRRNSFPDYEGSVDGTLRY